MPKIGFLPSNSRIVRVAYVAAAGSPGPFERKIPSGFNASASDADVVAGTTVTSKPAPTRQRRMLCLMPKSYATTRSFSRDAGSLPHTPRPSVHRYVSCVVTRERARVHARDADDAVSGEVVVERFVRAPVADDGRAFVDHEAGERRLA